MADWDGRYLAMAKLVASFSKDPSTQCGAVIVRPDRTLASVGFNGFPIGCDDDEALYADRETKYSRVVHAEVNAVLLAREPVHGYTLYTYPEGFGPTCDRCATVVIQAGIKRVVHVFADSPFASRWREANERGLAMYEEAGVEVVRYCWHDYQMHPGSDDFGVCSLCGTERYGDEQ
jgi:dCMP deaminase